MATKLRAAIAVTGPDGMAGWYDGGSTDGFAAISATTTLQNFPIAIVPQVDTHLAGGTQSFDSLISTTGVSTGPQPIQRLTGAQIVMSALFAAATNLNLYVRVRRSIDTLGAQIAAAGGALTSIPLTNPLSTPIVSGGTFVLVNAAGTAQTWTTSAAVAAGQTSIPVNSQTPSATFAAGVKATFTVGNLGLYGWLVSGTGTPSFPAGASLVMPPLTANTVLTPANDTNLFVGDVIELVAQTGSSTASVPLGAVSLLIA